MFVAFSSLADGQDWRLAVLAGLVGLLAGVVAFGLLSRRRARPANANDKSRQQNIRLDTALNNMSQGLCMFDADEKIVVFNRRFLEMYKLSPQVVKPGCDFRDLIQHRKEVGLLDAEPESYYRSIIDDIRQGKTTTSLIKTTEGRLVQAFNQPMPGGGWVTTHEDITERRQADKRQKLLIDELNHRVKNTLATVQSLAWQAARPGVPPQVAQERFQERLLALSRTHNLLNETHWEGAALKTILETELGPYATAAGRVRLDGPEVHLEARPAVVLGMAVHELTTNAVKHGALAAASGRVQVGWKIDDRGGEAVLAIDWCELGGPALAAQPSPGFGSRLLRQTITRELAGQLDIRFVREGVCCTIAVPLGSTGQQAA